MSEYRLTGEILNRSVATAWEEAKAEWTLHEVYETEEAQTCLCGHYPILEVCIIQNRKNGNRAQVGNCCVKKFMGLPSDKIFQSIKRVRKDGEKTLNVETLDYAYQRNWINKWEYGFCFDTMKKRELSPKQSEIRQRINEKVLRNMKRKGT